MVQVHVRGRPLRSSRYVQRRSWVWFLVGTLVIFGVWRFNEPAALVQWQLLSQDGETPNKRDALTVSPKEDLGEESQLHSLDTQKRSKQHTLLASPEEDTPEKGQVPSLDMVTPKGGTFPAWLGEKWRDRECIPFAKWQVIEHRPSSCNLFHEMDIAEPGALQFIACGGARCAFSMTSDVDGKVVLKWTKGPNFGTSTYRASMKDTMAMERLQHSDYILKIYGNCGSSQLLEAASHGALYDQMVVAKNIDNAPDGLLNDPELNLRVSYHLAKAVADVHGIDGPDAISFTHNDIACDQYIFIDGVFKLNDFHYASNEFRNRTTGVGCRRYGVSWSTKHTKLRAPEEILPGRGEEMVHRNQVDVWMLGNVLYYVLTKKWVMEGRTNKEVVKLYSKRKRAKIPSFIRKSREPAHQAMIRALFMAWTHDPEERPSAREIAEFLERELIGINGGKSDAPWRVLARPLPRNYEFFVDPENKTSSFIGFTDNYRVFPGDERLWLDKPW